MPNLILSGYVFHNISNANIWFVMALCVAGIDVEKSMKRINNLTIPFFPKSVSLFP